jgi:hypothetical protein
MHREELKNAKQKLSPTESILCFSFLAQKMSSVSEAAEKVASFKNRL